MQEALGEVLICDHTVKDLLLAYYDTKAKLVTLNAILQLVKQHDGLKADVAKSLPFVFRGNDPVIDFIGVKPDEQILAAWREALSSLATDAETPLPQPARPISKVEFEIVDPANYRAATTAH